MSRSTLYRTLALTGDRGRPMRLEYYLLIDDAYYDGGSLEVYGVELRRYSPDREEPEIARVRGITPLGSRIFDILQHLCDGTVTPVGLWEAMDSLLARG